MRRSGSAHVIHEAASRPPRGGVEAGAVRFLAPEAESIDLSIDHVIVQCAHILVGELESCQQFGTIVRDHHVGSPEQTVDGFPPGRRGEVDGEAALVA